MPMHFQRRSGGTLFPDINVSANDSSSHEIISCKRFSKPYLYAFSDGSIQVGKGNALIQLTLFKPEEYNVWLMEMRKNGLY